MSNDLDSDLYGDLYSSEEPNGDIGKAPADEEVQEPAPAVVSPPAPQAPQAPPESRDIQTTANVAKSPSPQAPVVPAPVPSTSNDPYQVDTSHIAPVTQQIPTYSEATEDEYSDPSGGAYGGTYQQMAVQERSIRPSEMKDEGKMFIGGLNWDTSDEALRKYFTQFGKVDACTIMRDAGGRSRCFAFLTFEDPASVNAVMVREHFLDGKIIDPKRAIPRQEHQRATKLFIGGLAGSVTSESMREFFSQFGKVVDSTVMLDRETGRSKGFGFISFEDTDVTPFLGFGQLEIDGKMIDVKLAQPRAQREQDGGASVYGAVGRGGGGGGGGVRGGFTGGAGAGFTGGNAAVFTNQGFNQASVTPQPGAASVGTTFDPQALANLYTRMFQIGAVNPMMGGGMNPMMGGMMGAGAGMMGGAGAGMGMGMGVGMGRGMGGMSGDPRGRGGGMMGAGAGPGAGAGGMGPNVPRGPRAAAGQGLGPQRAGRGQHGYHPYAR